MISKSNEVVSWEPPGSESSLLVGVSKSTQSLTSVPSDLANALTVQAVLPVLVSVRELVADSPGSRLWDVLCSEESHVFTSGIFRFRLMLSLAWSAGFGSLETVASSTKQWSPDSVELPSGRVTVTVAVSLSPEPSDICWGSTVASRPSESQSDFEAMASWTVASFSPVFSTSTVHSTSSSSPS